MLTIRNNGNTRRDQAGFLHTHQVLLRRNYAFLAFVFPCFFLLAGVRIKEALKFLH